MSQLLDTTGSTNNQCQPLIYIKPYYPKAQKVQRIMTCEVVCAIPHWKKIIDKEWRQSHQNQLLFQVLQINDTFRTYILVVLGFLWQHILKIQRRYILCQKKLISITLFYKKICQCLKNNFFIIQPSKVGQSIYCDSIVMQYNRPITYSLIVAIQSK